MKRLNVNLASAPFVNRYLLSGTLACALILALGFTIFNAVSFYLLGTSYRNQRDTLKKQEATLGRLESEIKDKKALLAGSKIAVFSEEADFISQVLAAKRFSWVTFLGDLERVKPYGLMFTSVAPSITKEGTVVVSLSGVGNKREEVLKLEENLFGDSCFQKVQIGSEKKEENSPWTTFQLTVEYIPEAMRGH